MFKKPCRQQNGHVVFGICSAKQEIFQVTKQQLAEWISYYHNGNKKAGQ